MRPGEFWSLTLVELSLMLDAYAERFEKFERAVTFSGWLAAALQRQQRIQSFGSLFNPRTATAQKLDGAEAEAERARHAELVAKLAPETLTG